MFIKLIFIEIKNKKYVLNIHKVFKGSLSRKKYGKRYKNIQENNNFIGR
jgi:hypothetical protein